MAVHDSYSLDPNPNDGVASEAGEQRQVFGPYLLFKLLKRDSLGEVYRAGRLGANAIESVVSLRLFKAGDIDGERFWQGCQARKDLGTLLSGGPFAETVDIGFEAGIPYVAHDYVFGRSLAELLLQAREASEPIPFEQALLLMDRISNGLRNAYEKRVEDIRVSHGFLIPEFVHLSNEGEVRLTGFETGEALHELAGSPGQTGLAGYLSPEVNQKLPTKPCDDIYSLGAIFCELLTGGPLPPLNPAESSRWVEAAILEAEGTPLPEDVRHLIRESLLPRDQRIQNAEKWHKALVGVINSSGKSPTTFNLAFFMHMLFGDELDREAETVEAEKRAGLPKPATPTPVVAPAPVPVAPAAPTQEKAAPAPAPEPKPAPTAPPAVTESPSASFESLTAPELDDIPGPDEGAVGSPSIRQSGSMSAASADTSRRWIGIAVASVLVAGTAIGFFVTQKQSKDSTLEVAAAPRLQPNGPGSSTEALPAETVTGIDALSPPLSPDELESQARSLVAERAGDMEESLKKEYDERRLKLRDQLEEARKIEAESAAVASTPAPPAPVEEIAVRSEQPPAPEGGAAAVAANAEPEGPSVEGAAQTQPNVAAVASAQPPTVEPSPPVAQPQPQPEQPKPAVSQPETVETGSVVSLGPGVEAPKLVRQPSVLYPPAAARLKRRATVKVRVLVDEKGKPTEITQVGDKIGLGFDQAALQAARTTRWTPPMKNGVPVKVWVDLTIDFRP